MIMLKKKKTTHTWAVPAVVLTHVKSKEMIVSCRDAVVKSFKGPKIISHFGC